MVDKIKIGEYYYCEWHPCNYKASSIVYIYNLNESSHSCYYEIEQILLVENNKNSVVGWSKNTDNFKRLATQEEIDYFHKHYIKPRQKPKELIIQLW